MTRYRVGSIGDLAAGDVRRVEVGGQALCLAHVPGRGFFALDDRCTHEDVELSGGDLDGIEVECPAHGSRFDVTTGAVRGLPADVPAVPYAVHVVDDDVFVDL